VRRFAVVFVGAFVLGLLPSAGLADGQTLVGTVGPGFSIRLTDTSGALVRHLDPGAYTVQVHDESVEHNFHLFGPGVDQATEVETVGDVTWPVILSDGSYRYVCDVHANLSGSFTVGTQPPPPVSAQKLVARVGPKSTISLKTPTGVRVKSLVAGRFSLTVHDLSASDNFHLMGPGLNRKSRVAKKQTLTWKLTLRTGTYRYRSDAHPKLKGSFTVKVAA
jgi:hypothetical protein